MKERDYTIDLIRLISIGLVVVIHVSNYYNRYLESLESISYVAATFYNSVARISVPLFFMISGALSLSHDYDFHKLFYKIRHFLLILVVWTGIYLVFDLTFMQYKFEISDYINLIFEPLKPHLWFMYAIISLYIVNPFIRILVKNMDKTYQNYFMILWFAFTGFVQIIRVILDYIGYDNDITYSVPLVQGTYYLGYYMVGYFLYNRIKEKDAIPMKLCSRLFYLSTTVVFLGTYFFSNQTEAYFADLLTYRNLFVMISSVTFFILVIGKVKITSPRLKTILSGMSPLLFGVYLLHIIPFDLLIRSIHIKDFNAVYGVPLFSAVIFSFTLFCVFLLSKLPMVKHIIK
ncbi:MAG: acyltransferase family protein [Lachnospiraceae bacterium]|nr:acyltransferase family protein [Lachnospiraceae bacterium]